MGILGRRRRRRRARELEQRLQQLDWLDEHYGLGALPRSEPPRRRDRLSWAPVAVGALVALGAGVLHPSLLPGELRERLGLAGERLLPAPEASAASGAYTFLATQRDGEPVGYDPCQPLEIVVNPEGAPEDYEELVRVAVARTREATGLSIEVVDQTSDRDYDRRRAGQPALVMWADEEEVPELAGTVAGIGGSTHVQRAFGRAYFVTGMVVLDHEDFELMPRGRWRQAVVDHEFAHLVGLGHVDDRDQLMHEGSPTTPTYGEGDLAGLAALGSIPCR